MTNFIGKLIASSVIVAACGSFAHAADRHVMIINDTSYVMTEFYASNIGQNNWEEDILGKDILEPGEKININIDDGTNYCRYDVKAVFKNGYTAVRRNVNVCTVTSWTIHDAD